MEFATVVLTPRSYAANSHIYTSSTLYNIYAFAPYVDNLYHVSV